MLTLDYISRTNLKENVYLHSIIYKFWTLKKWYLKYLELTFVLLNLCVNKLFT